MIIAYTAPSYELYLVMDFTQSWSDKKLYDYYFDLSDKEIGIVEKTMRPLVLEKDDIGKDFYETYRGR